MVSGLYELNCSAAGILGAGKTISFSIELDVPLRTVHAKAALVWFPVHMTEALVNSGPSLPVDAVKVTIT